MAITRSGNMIYVDTTGSAIAEKSVRLAHLIITATAAASLILKDPTVTALKLRWDIAAAGSQEIAFPVPPVFPNGIEVDTITNCVATLVLAGKA